MTKTVHPSLLSLFCVCWPYYSEGRTLDNTLISRDYAQYCEFPANENPPYSVLAYGAMIQGVQPVLYNAATSSLSTLFPPYRPDPFKYHIQATRGRDLTHCSFCLYDMDADAPFIQYSILGGQPYDASPMFGPCMDRAVSVKTSCVQNTFLFPPTFVGEYHYPDQFEATNGPLNPDVMFEHQYLYKDDVTGKEPTDFGLGKGHVKAMLESVTIRNRLDDSINQTLTDQFLHDYSADNGWLLWAQHYCTPTCHRNAEYQVLKVQESDWLNKSPLLQYLSRRIQGQSALTMLRCNLCPPFHMAYLWYKGSDRPFYDNLVWNAISPACYPWFGALPVLNSSNSYDFQINSVVSHTNASSGDSVFYPSSSTYLASTPCAVDTYNDVCAHTIRYYTRVWRLVIANVVGLTPAQAQAKAVCKACPPGYHTDGKTGSWFCIPPAGNLFVSRLALLAFQDSANRSLAWTRRDNIGYEFECGYLATHCKQCSSTTQTAGFLPDAFNQKMILAPILTVIPCPRGYYCPHALYQDKQRCPLANKPYSPLGSSSEANCTCAAGTFLNASQQCEPCRAPSVCPVGMYLAGYSDCISKDGMTTFGKCMDCTNAPAGISYTLTGIEYFYQVVDGNPTFRGACPFACPYAHQLTVASSADNECNMQWKCVAATALQSGGQLVYSLDLLTVRDSFVVSLANGCDISLQLTEALNSPGKLSLIPVYTSCLDYPALCTRDSPCRVLQAATLATQVTCTPCDSLPQGASFTDAAKAQRTWDVSKNCAFQCDQASFYVNKTAHSCQSCPALTALVCANNNSWQVRGGGCAGNSTEFPSAISQMRGSDWCVSCPKSLPSADSNQYLNMELCAYVNCDANPPVNKYFIPPGCGGTSAGVLGNCITGSSCQAYQYLKGSACSRNSTPVCTNCTDFNMGYYKTANCSHGGTTDATWEPCLAGHTCNGAGGQPTPCPYPKTSQAGPNSLCVCPAGMKKNALDATQCEYTQCPDRTQINPDPIKYGNIPPGDNGVSHYYMQLDTSTQSNKCTLCPKDGITLDEHAVGIESCRCPFNQYMMFANSGGCTACTSECPGCWRGDAVCGTMATAPPFMMSLPSTCNAGFTYTPDGSSRTGTGSAVYVEKADVLAGGWISYYDTSSYSGGTITHLATTSPLPNDDGLPRAMHLSFYMLSVYPLTVYVKPIPTPDASISLTPWCVVSVGQTTAQNYRTAQLAASSWAQQTVPPSSSPVVPFHYANSAFVGVVFYNVLAGSLLLSINRVAYTYTSEIEWISGGTDCGESPKVVMHVLHSSGFLLNQTDVPALQYQKVYPGTANDASDTFYVAVNDWSLRTTAVMACSATDVTRRATLDFTQSDGRRITAMAVLPSASGPMLYLAFDTSPQSVRLVPWTPVVGEESEEIFFPAAGSFSILSLSFAWSTEPLLWARVMEHVVTADTTTVSSRLGSQRLYVADKDYQRTFTPVQQMPAASHPSIGPSVIGTNLYTATLVAAHGTKLYTLPLHRLLPTVESNGVTRARYLPDDGTVGVLHTCVRPRTCSLAQQYWNKDLQRCMCRAGYYKDTTISTTLTCRACPEGSYCLNNEKRSCSAPFTSDALAQTANECVCPQGQAYVLSTCRPCAHGYWCPNRWDAFACPGHSTSADSSLLYPFGCVCEAGYTGPACTTCPSGRACPTSSTATVTNYVLSFHMLFTTSSNSSDSVCQMVTPRVLAFFAPVDPSVQIYCIFLPANPPHTTPMVVLMVQTSTSAGASQAPRMDTNMNLNFTTFVVSSLPHFTSNQIASNVPMSCSTDQSKIPTADAKTCQCAAGWRTSATSGVCIACEPNYYKPTPGPCSSLQCVNGGCLPCPSGLTSSTGASACSSSSGRLQNNGTTDSSSSSTPANLAAIIGGVVGGVILVVILLYVINQFYATPSS